MVRPVVPEPRGKPTRSPLDPEAAELAEARAMRGAQIAGAIVALIPVAIGIVLAMLHEWWQ